MAAKFDVTADDREAIMAIAKRATELVGYGDTLQFAMSMTACHANGCPLDLARLRQSAPADLVHDVFGIHRHIDKRTGKLRDCFLPRYSR